MGVKDKQKAERRKRKAATTYEKFAMLIAYRAVTISPNAA